MRYFTPAGLVSTEIWVRLQGEDLVITANLDGGLLRWRGTGSRRPAIRRSTSRIPFEPEAADPFFQLVSSRYERAGLIVTSYKNFAL